jgi:enoyl-CoA hydratase/carnithine racemase
VAPSQMFIQRLPKVTRPMIAAVDGLAVGVGVTMLLHCDLVYAGEGATLLFPFVDLGLVPEAGSSLLLPQVVGHQRAAAALMLGEPLSAVAAAGAGLVNQVLPDAEVLGFAHDQAARLAAKPVTALLETKRLLRSGAQAALLDRIEDEGAVFTRLLGEPEARAALSSFLARP